MRPRLPEIKTTRFDRGPELGFLAFLSVGHGFLQSGTKKGEMASHLPLFEL
jgi:hypothetical protein